MSVRTGDSKQLRELERAAQAGLERAASLFTDGWTNGDVVRFHSQEKFLVLAMSEPGYREVGPLAARVSDVPRPLSEDQYSTCIRIALSGSSSVPRAANALEHLKGMLKSGARRRHVADMIDQYRLGRLSVRTVGRELTRHAVVERNSYLVGVTLINPP